MCVCVFVYVCVAMHGMIKYCIWNPCLKMFFQEYGINILNYEISLIAEKMKETRLFVLECKLTCVCMLT